MIDSDFKLPVERLHSSARIAFIVGAIGLVASVVLGLGNKTQFYQSWLQAAMLMLGVPGGCLALLMIQNLTGGKWAFFTRKPMEAAVKTLPLAAILFLPVLFGMHELYHWTHADAVAEDALLQYKTPYLNTPFFIARTIATFAIWIGLGTLLVKWSARQDETGDERLSIPMRKLSGIGILLYGLSATWSSWDWTMSLEPHWFSSLWGPMFAVGQGLTTFAFLVIILAWIGKTPVLQRTLQGTHYHDLGNLTFAFVILWIYMHFSQFLIIWSANLPEEILWYLDREHMSWQALALFLAVFHFVLPFFLLLTRVTKLKASYLVKITGLILVVRIAEYYWTIAPTFHDQVTVTLLDATTLAAVLGIWFGVYCRSLSRLPAVPLHDPRFKAILAGPSEDVSHG